MTLSSIEEFEVHLQNTLNHLYDPLFRPDEQVFDLLEVSVSQGMEGVRQALRKSIEEMKPETAIPTGAPLSRYFEVLANRYLESLSQEEAAYRLGMTTRNLRRIQQKAISTLVQHIWGQYQLKHPIPGQAEEASAIYKPEPSPILRELEVLQRNSPGAVANLGESVERIQAIMLAGMKTQNIELAMDQPENMLTVSVHPSMLDQILLSTIEQLVKQSTGGGLHIQASTHGKLAEIEILSLRNEGKLPDLADNMVVEMLKLVNGTRAVEQEGQQLKVTYRFPIASSIPILLIDDNPDFFYLFRRYTLHTRYALHNIREGAKLRQALAEYNPQIIILDVLLPDVDGWQLLMDFQNLPPAPSIPVIVCTALDQEELAYSLGASAFLSKPVSREAFLQTLDSIVS